VETDGDVELLAHLVNWKVILLVDPVVGLFVALLQNADRPVLLREADLSHGLLHVVVRGQADPAEAAARLLGAIGEPMVVAPLHRVFGIRVGGHADQEHRRVHDLDLCTELVHVPHAGQRVQQLARLDGRLRAGVVAMETRLPMAVDDPVPRRGAVGVEIFGLCGLGLPFDVVVFDEFPGRFGFVNVGVRVDHPHRCVLLLPGLR
jgi:hypothetical protein